MSVFVSPPWGVSPSPVTTGLPLVSMSGKFSSSVSRAVASARVSWGERTIQRVTKEPTGLAKLDRWNETIFHVSSVSTCSK